MTKPSFAMITCAHGAEKMVKESMTEQGWRLAFSRPGFVTAKHDDEQPPPQGIFVRTSATTLGQARDEDAGALLEQMIQCLEQGGLENQKFDQLHVWPKDRAAIGRFGFEPGGDEVSQAVSEVIFQKLADRWLTADHPNRVAAQGDRVLDVVLVDPSHWFFGWHTARHWPSRWPGGVQPISPKYEPISRAYYKAAESITWSGFDMKPDDLVIEVGSAPGGATGRLLELGFRVLGIDPAEMDPRVLKHPKFRHLRARAGDLPRREFRGAKWMLVDSNVTPEKTLVTVKNIVQNQHSQLRGLILTMKLGNYDNATQIQPWVGEVESWGASQIRVRQLARNRCEVCFAVTL